MGFQRDLKDTVRDTKNFFKGYSKVQVKLRRATSVDPWGPTSAQMEDIAKATHGPTLLADLIYIFDRRLNDHGKYWRHVYKSLVVMEYCIVCGSESFVRYAKDTIYVIKTLKEFQYVDERGRDQGAMIRQKSREIVELLQNESMLAEARRTKTIPRQQERNSRSISPISKNSFASHQTATTRRSNRSGGHEEEEMLRAIEESKRTAADEARRRSSSDEAFFANLKPKNGYSMVHTDASSSTMTTITHPQPKVILTHVPHTISVRHESEKQEGKVHLPFLDDDPFTNFEQSMTLSDDEKQQGDDFDPFANAEEVLLERNPFEEAEEVVFEKPTPQNNTSSTSQKYNIPVPKDPFERSAHENDSVGMKPVKPMNLTPGFSSTRAQPNIQHFN
jgi:hypothetical protein